MGLTNSPYVRGVEQKEPHSTFCVRVKLWLHSDMHTLFRSSWIQRMLTMYVWGQSGASGKEEGYHYLASDYGAQPAI
jgi:hypothetical protein